MFCEIKLTDEMTSSVSSMDISDSFRPEDLSKTDFFDFVSPPQQEIHESAKNIATMSKGNEQPLQGFDQFWGAEKETQHRLESAIFEDFNRYCWNQQNSGNISVSSASANSSTNPQVLNNGDGQIYTITVLNSSSTDQWLRKDISSTSTQPNGLDVNLDTILSNYPYVKTEYFSYDDSGFGTAESTKEDINYQHPPTHQILQPQSAGVTTTSVLLENSLNTASDLIGYTEMNNNNNEWSEDRNENKDWETCEANESPESLLRSALLQGKSYNANKTVVNLQNPPQKLTKDEDLLRRALFTEDQETLTFANQNPQSTLSQHVSTIIDDMFLTLDTTFTDEFEKMKRITSEVQQFCAIDATQDNNTYSENICNGDNNESQNLTSNDITNNSLISNNSNNTGKITKNRCNGIKTTKKYKKTLTNNNTNMNNMNNNNNDTSTINNNLNSSNKNAMINLTSMNSSVSAIQPNSSLGSTSATCNGIRKERSLHYCSICSKGFKDKYSVNVHIRTHTGEKPFACSLCGKSFRQKAHLAKHYQTHLQKKQHQKHSLGSSQPITQATM